MMALVNFCPRTYLQGIVVSMLYCFTSSDVKIALAKRYYRFKVRWQSRKIGKKLVSSMSICYDLKKWFFHETVCLAGSRRYKQKLQELGSFIGPDDNPEALFIGEWLYHGSAQNYNQRVFGGESGDTGSKQTFNSQPSEFKSSL